MELGQIMKMAGQLRDQLQQAQQQAAELKVTGEAGGGLVAVDLNGKYEALAVRIAPEAMEPKPLLEDLLRAAITMASHKVAEAQREKMGALAGALGVDLGALGL